jgi:hypothetical protein
LSRGNSLSAFVLDGFATLVFVVSMGNSQDSGAVYLSLFEKDQGAMGIPEFKLLDCSLLNFFGTRGRKR